MGRSTHSEAFKAQFATRLTELVEQHLGLSFSDIAQAMGYANSSTVLKAARGEGCLDLERLAILAGLPTLNGGSPNLHWLISGSGAPTLAALREPDQAQPLDLMRREVVEKVRQFDRGKVEAMLVLLGA